MLEAEVRHESVGKTPRFFDRGHGEQHLRWDAFVQLHELDEGPLHWDNEGIDLSSLSATSSSMISTWNAEVLFAGEVLQNARSLLALDQDLEVVPARALPSHRRMRRPVNSAGCTTERTHHRAR